MAPASRALASSARLIRSDASSKARSRACFLVAALAEGLALFLGQRAEGAERGHDGRAAPQAGDAPFLEGRRIGRGRERLESVLFNLVEIREHGHVRSNT
jgi:hypothetical protein